MRTRRREGGFSLVEIIVVLAIVGLVLTLVVMRVDHLSPKYALRAAAREIGATIDLARGKAASSGRKTAIEYDLNRATYQIYTTNRDGQAGSGPRGLDPVGLPKELPRGINFKSVYLHHKSYGMKTAGQWLVTFDPLAIEGSHIVHLENAEGKQLSIKYNALLGSCDYAEGLAEFESAPDQ